MGRQITVNEDNVVVGGTEHDTGDVVIISDAEFDALTSAGRFTDGTLTDGGAHADAGDDVSVQGAAVAAPAALTATAPAALTSTVAATSPPTKTEFDALRADVVALRTTVAALVTDITALRTTVASLRTNLTGAGHPLST